MSRTGTTSLGHALEILGIRTIHYPHDATLQHELWSGNGRLGLLEQYDAVVDISVAPFYALLDATWPDARFILTLREREGWLGSMERHHAVLQAEWSFLDPQFRRFTVAINEELYGAPQFDRQRFAHAYDTHIAAVRNHFAGRPDSLLEMNLTDGAGWEPLCRFLRLPLPDQPFPETHSAELLGAWHDRTMNVRNELQRLFRRGSTIALIDEAKVPGVCVIDGLTVLPFPEHDGRWTGRPASGEQAAREAERLIVDGIDAVVVLWPALWWLGYYEPLHRRLRSWSSEVWQTDDMVAYVR
jgi:Sulfotransferase domain